MKNGIRVCEESGTPQLKLTLSRIRIQWFSISDALMLCLGGWDEAKGGRRRLPLA